MAIFLGLFNRDEIGWPLPPEDGHLGQVQSHKVLNDGLGDNGNLLVVVVERAGCLKSLQLGLS